MRRHPVWLVSIACVGMAATAAAIALLWFVVSNPVAFAQVLGRGL